MNKLDNIEKAQLKNNIPDFIPGDTVRVHVRIKESETKERLQAFEGIVIARRGKGIGLRLAQLLLHISNFRLDILQRLLARLQILPVRGQGRF